jgi:hypothetical protein
MTNMTRSEKGFFKGFLIAMFSTLFWIGVTILIVVNLNGCAAQTAPVGTGNQGDPCGVDLPACGNGLECFGVCTFECGEKYTQQASGEYVYGTDAASVDRCTELNGTCNDSLGVGINICNQRISPDKSTSSGGYHNHAPVTQ